MAYDQLSKLNLEMTKELAHNTREIQTGQSKLADLQEAKEEAEQYSFLNVAK